MKSEPSVLRDFTVDRRVWLLSGVSVGIGICATALAFVLLRCIALSTNLFYYHRFSFACLSSGQPVGLLDGDRARSWRSSGGLMAR